MSAGSIDVDLILGRNAQRLLKRVYCFVNERT